MKALLLLILLSSVIATASSREDQAFSFHLFSEPVQFDPQMVNSASGTYLITNIYRGLFRYHAKKGLILELAKKCEKRDTKLVCELRDKIFWSNGEPIVAQDFVNAFRHLLEPSTKSTQVDLLLSLKNANQVWQGRLPSSELGVQAVSDRIIKFEFEKPDSEFELKLSHPALVPRKSKTLTNGPYKIAEWKKGHHIRLVANNYYDTRSRPDVLIYFIDSDNTALRLYETGKLKLLRRLVASEVLRFKDRSDFFQMPMARFDYIGFGPQLKDYPRLREAIATSLDYGQFKELFFSLGSPGCPSIPNRFVDKVPCLKFSPKKAKELFSLEVDNLNKIEWVFSYSLLGGEDISRSAEWFQGQWQKNLGLKIELKSYEQGTYIPLLANSPPALFRKGVGLDRPTCSAALEIFTSKNAENYIGFKNKTYDKLFEQTQFLSGQKQRAACRKAIEILIKEHWIIPLGQIHFAMLASPRFKGWEINELNQLDLTDLSYIAQP